MEVEHLDVVVVGAGIAGVGAGHYLNERCPQKRFAILEARPDMGGTWDLMRYPGIRSDSDMHTFSFGFKPCKETTWLADGPSILGYLEEVAAEAGLTERIRCNHKVVAASWSTQESCWTVEVERQDTGERVQLTCDFLWCCTGYYRYDRGYTPDFPGIDRFRGEVVHPQHWPEDLDYAGKRVVVIGSGATAVTLVPVMAESAEHVTMLQRSPTYMASAPPHDLIAKILRRILPLKAAYTVTRWKNTYLQIAVYQISQRAPRLVKFLLKKGLMRSLPAGYDVDKHFTPTYDPWDQRLCGVLDNDLFDAIGDGTVEIVTDHIETFTEGGVKLKSGRQLTADLVVSATGLNLVFLGGLTVAIDGEDVDLSQTMPYKGTLLSEIPNLAFTFGYTNASWTLRVDLVSNYVTRLLNHMDRHGYAQCVPRLRGTRPSDKPLVPLTSGYVLRALDRLPKQGPGDPWQFKTNYVSDRRMLRGSFEDPVLEFSRAGNRRPAEPAAV
jgi:cation diffusion facilitator CzcD-associated flavoprotein CzcO